MKGHICSDFEIVLPAVVGPVVGLVMACQAATYCPASLFLPLQNLEHVLARPSLRTTAGGP